MNSSDNSGSSKNGNGAAKNGNGMTTKNIAYIMNTKNWWGPLTFIFIISVLGVGMIAFQTYNDAPPTAQFVTAKGEVLISEESIQQGQIIFHKYALM